ncbi:MAG: dTMP kinase [Candidatus Nitrospinota bacterium M3_3B_026]
MKGLLITFEGVEGSGKSTQIKLLAERLRAAGRDVELAREPGGTPAGDAIRGILLDPRTDRLDPVTELLLFSAARRELAKNVIAPAITAGKIVLVDRFADSTMAYQGFARGLDRELISVMTNIVLGGVRPDLTIVLDMPAEEGLARANGRIDAEGSEEARFEKESLEFHHRVRSGYLEIAGSDPGRVKVVEAAGEAEKIGEEVFRVVRDILPGGGEA